MVNVEIMPDSEAGPDVDSLAPEMSASGMEAQALIEQARQHQRRRRRRALFLSIVVLLVVGGVLAARFGGRGNPPPAAPSGSPPGVAPGSVNGILRFEGITAHSVAGTVLLVGAHGERIAVRVPADGRFTVHIPPGTYTATGHSPQVLSEGVEVTCTSRAPVIVRSGATTPVVLGCEGF